MAGGNYGNFEIPSWGRAAEDRRRIEEARTSINVAARNVSTIYLSFLLLGIYVAISVGSTTDQQLLTQRELPLPLLSVALPISAFYLLVPLGFVVVLLPWLIIGSQRRREQRGIGGGERAVPSI